MEDKMMKYRVTGILVFVLGLIWSGAVFGQSGPTNNFDGPHNTYSINMMCDSCHLLRQLGVNEPFWYADAVDIDDTLENRVCWSCHSDVTAHFKETHSSVSLGDKYNAYDADPANDPNPTYTDAATGRWHVDCTGCHWGRGDTHGTNNSQHNAGAGRLASGTYVVTSYDSVTNRTTVTMTEDAGQEVDGIDWSRYIFVADWPTWPELNKWKSFKILSSVDTNPNDGVVELTVMGDARGNTVDTCYIIYGKYQNAYIDNKNIVFYDQSGPYSYLGTSGSSTDGVCEVCHVVAGQGEHPADEFGNDCKRCHMVRYGFKPDKACNECHGLSTQEGQNGYGAPLVAGQAPAGDMVSTLPLGAHQRHVVDRTFTCETCHNGHNMPTRDKKITMSFTGLAVLNSSPVYDPPAEWTTGKWQYWDGTNPWTSTTSTQDCSNVYCHSTGQGDGEGNATPVYSTPDWGNASTGACGTCHGNGDAGNEPASGSHTAHLTTSVMTIQCQDCHSGTLDGRAGDPYELAATHVDGQIDVDPALKYESAPNVPADGTPGNEYGNCYNASCHNNGITVSSPKWGSVVPECNECHTSPPNDVSHNAHMNSTVMSNIACSNCHDNADNNTVTPPAEHLDGTVDVYDVTPGDLGYPSDVALGSQTWTSCSAGATSANYCHDNGFGKVDSPVWGSTGVAQCSECHEVRPGTGSHGTHLNHATVTVDCGNCHTGAVEGSTPPASGHLDGARAADGDCSVCHVSITQPTWGTDLSGVPECVRCHYNPTGSQPSVDSEAARAPEVGAHLSHLDRDGNGATAHNITTPVACSDCHVVPSGVGDAGHINDGTAGAELTFSGRAVLKGQSPDWNNITPGACTNTYCHAPTLPNGTADGANRAPDFSTPVMTGAATNDCVQCHQAPPDPSVITSHQGKGLANCVECHVDTDSYDSGTDTYTFGDLTKHINGSLDVSACTACHGASGSTGAPLIPSDLVGNATADPATGHGVGAHQKHVVDEGLLCADCHFNSGMPTVDSVITIRYNGLGSGGCYDGDADATFSANYSYAGDLCGTQNPGSQTCSNIYCHSSGQGATANDATPVYSTPDWNDPATGACGTCHSNTDPGTGSHTAHLNTTIWPTAPSCGDCHTGATTSSYNSPNHRNQSIDVANTYSAGGAAGNGYGTCSTASCHNDGTGQVTSPVWGTSITDCTECHGQPPATGSHGPHLADSLVQVNNCGNCHDGAQQGTTAPANHGDGTVEVYDTTPGDLGWDGAAKTCSTTSCHIGTTPAWGTVITDCTECHGQPPATGSHGVHMADSQVQAKDCGSCHDGAQQGTTAPANHRDGTVEVYDTTAGDLGWDGAAKTCSTTSCHIGTTPAWGTVITDCTECHGQPPATGSHNKHFSSSFLDSANMGCGKCHDGAVQGTTAPANHRDGTVEVYDTTPGDLGWTNPGCSTAYCHSDGLGNYATTAPSWGVDTSTGCDFCHGYTDANGLHPPDNGSHPDPVNNVDNCSVCHSQVNGTNDGFLDATTHIDGTVQPGTGGSCDSCHGYPPTPGDNKGGGGYTPHGEAKGAHAVHIAELEQREGVTLDPNNDSFGSGAMAAVCGTCHDLSVGHMTGIHVDPSARADKKYWFDPVNGPTYNGVVDTSSGAPDNIPKTCSNISCHFTETPVWAEPGTE